MLFRYYYKINKLYLYNTIPAAKTAKVRVIELAPPQMTIQRVSLTDDYNIVVENELQKEYEHHNLKIRLSSVIHTSFGLSGFQHLVGLHHASVGEAAVVFILFASPWKV